MARKAKRLGDQLRTIKKKHAGVFVTIVKKTLIDLSSAIIMDTAVDRGVARGNWVAGFGQINFERGTIDTDGGSTVARIASQIDAVSTLDDFYMTNTLAYIGVLEHGLYPSVGPKTVQTGDGIFPIQADEGMVRVNIARFQSTFEKIARLAA